MENKLDMYQIQCQFARIEEKPSIMFGLYSRELRKNIDLFNTEVDNLDNEISKYLKNKTEDQICRTRCRIEYSGNVSIEALNGMAILADLDTMPEEYQAMYAKFKLLEN